MRKDWNIIKNDYIQGGGSYTKLAKKHNVSCSALSKRAKKEGWVELREKVAKKAENDLVKKAGRMQSRIDSSYYDIVGKLLKKAEELVDTVPVWSVPALKEMAAAMKYLKECNDVKSIADAREQNARIKKIEKELKDGSREPAPIRVIMSSDADGFGQ